MSQFWICFFAGMCQGHFQLLLANKCVGVLSHFLYNCCHILVSNARHSHSRALSRKSISKQNCLGWGLQEQSRWYRNVQCIEIEETSNLRESDDSNDYLAINSAPCKVPVLFYLLVYVSIYNNICIYIQFILQIS